ncbi:MAG: leucine-rich repeat domain-containing protein [Oligoflexales bacterium]
MFDVKKILIIRCLWLFVTGPACKQDKGKSAEELCREKAAEGYLWSGSKCVKPEKGSLDKKQCSAIKGASWNQGDYLCTVPSSDSECQFLGNDFYWNGDQCSNSTAPKNFFRHCSDPDSDDIKHTVAIISKPYIDGENVPSCQDIYEQLRKKTSLTYQSENLVDLRPFQRLTKLKFLDLWNNKITDISSLANLKNLEVLKLGHNQIYDVGPLQNLKSLKILSLFENQIKNIAVLNNLSKLERLDVSFNRIIDLDQLNPEKYTKGFFSEGNDSPPPVTYDVEPDAEK